MFSRRRSLNEAGPSSPTSPPTGLTRLLSRRTRPATAPPPSAFHHPLLTMADVQSAPIQTTNTLGSKDRLNLIRRTRKLEQVFGVSMLVMDSTASEPQPRAVVLESEPETVSAPLRRRLKSLRRTASTTAVPSASTSSSSVQAKSGSDRVNPPARSSSKPTKTLVYAKSIPNHNVPVLQLVSSPAKGDRLNVPAGRLRSGSVASTATTDSVDSALTVISPTLKAHRHRQFQNAKLHRHLGESIPADLLVLPNSSKPDLPPLVRLKSGANHRRIVSDDVSIRSVARFEGNEEEVALLKPTRRSLEDDQRATMNVPVPTKSELLTPQEKNLHVRRAQKMASKFGEAPPPALLAITNAPAKSDRIRKTYSLDFSPTSVSLPLKSAKSPAGSPAVLAYRTNENESPLVEGKIRGRPRSSSESSFRSSLGNTMTVAAASLILISFANSSLSPISDASATTPKEKDVETILTPVDVDFPLPSPVVEETVTKRTPNVLKKAKSQNFSVRRRQAGKLTRFFGVEYPDLYDAMVSSVPVPAPKSTRSMSISVTNSRPDKEAPPPLPVRSLTPEDPGLLRVGGTDSCRWSVKNGREVKQVLDTLRLL